MKIIKTYKKFLSKENKQFINNFLLGNNFPYYLSEYDANNPHYHVFPKKGARLVLVATFQEIK